MRNFLLKWIPTYIVAQRLTTKEHFNFHPTSQSWKKRTLIFRPLKCAGGAAVLQRGLNNFSIKKKLTYNHLELYYLH